MAAPSVSVQIGNEKPMNEKARYEKLRESLRSEWSSWEASYRELGRYLRPRMPKFLRDTPNKGNRRDMRIVNNWGGFAVRTLSAGMMAGITSPSRPWFRLTSPDRDLSDNKAVKVWLADVEERMRTVFLRSNLYQQLPRLYTSLGVFGTGAMFEEEDDETVIRFTTYAPGSFYIGTDGRNKVSTLGRDFQMTVRQLVDKFGMEALTPATRSQAQSDNWDIWIDVVHIVEQNPFYDENKLEAKYKKYRSVYYEKQNAIQSDQFLRISGYDAFPLLCPRWTVDGDDEYGTGPGWDVIGDVKELQLLTKQKAKANELKIRPPLLMDPALQSRKKSMVPGGSTYVKFDGRNGGARALFEVNWDTNGTERDIQQIQHRISRGLYEDLFLMLANNTNKQPITATEVAERQQEKMLALGPVLETLNDELLDPIIDRTFSVMMRRGMFLDPPPELEGQNLKVEYISIMAQAQRQIGLRGLEMSINFTATAMQLSPGVIDVMNMDDMVREYAEKVGLSPEQVRTVEEVAEIRQQRAAMQQAQAEGERELQDAQTAKTLSETDTSNPNALTDILQAQNEEALA